MDGWKAAVAVCASLMVTLGSVTGAPANDNFTNRIDLTGSPVSATGDNTYATREPGEPTQGVRSIWWSWTAPTSGTYTVTATVHNFTPYLFVYTGSQLTNLTLLGSDIGGDLDRTAQVVVQAAEGTSYSMAVTTYAGAEGSVVLSIVHASPPNVVLATPTNGATIYTTDNTLLRVDVTDADGDVTKVDFFAKWQGAMQFLGTATNFPFELSYTFGYNFGDGGPQSALIQARATDATGITADSPVIQCWVSYPPPPNDDFTNRLGIMGSFFTVAANNLYATKELGDPTPGRGSVWWAWTAPTSGVYAITAVALGGAFVPFVGVYSGSTMAGLVPVGTATGTLSDTSYSARVAVDVQGGNVYSIAVSAVALYAGELRLCITPPNAPATAEFEAITAEPWPPGFVDGAVNLRLWFRTGGGSRWRIEASSNFVTWEGISQEFQPNCRLDFTTSNARTRWVAPYYYEWYSLPHLFYRLASFPSNALSGPTKGSPTKRSTEGR